MLVVNYFWSCYFYPVKLSKTLGYYRKKAHYNKRALFRVFFVLQKTVIQPPHAY